MINKLLQVCVKNCTSTYYTYLETLVTDDRAPMLCKEGVKPTDVVSGMQGSQMVKIC